MPDEPTYRCARCGHSWTGRRDTPPKTCPKCRTPNWRKATSTVHCFKCDHAWAVRGKNARRPPERCAGCNALLTRFAIFYGVGLNAYRRSKQYRKLHKIFLRAKKRR